MESLRIIARDVCFALRLMRKHLGLTCAVVVTLAVGIGLDAGAFLIINGMLFRARAKDAPERFVQIDARDISNAGTLSLPTVSLTDYAAYRNGATTLESIAGWLPAASMLRDSNGASQPMLPLLVTCSFFQVYPVVPIAGRVLRDDDCRRGAPPVVVIGERDWRTRLGSDPAIVGRDILINEHAFTVIGVTPADYDGALRGPMWIPYTHDAALLAGRELMDEPDSRWLVMIGRLRPGVSRAQALANLEVIAGQQDRLTSGRRTIVRVTNGSLFEMLPSRSTAAGIVLFVMSGLTLVLLVACANVTLLLLSQAAARRRELAIRVSLGASRMRLLQMAATEAAVLIAVAAPLSAWIAYLVPIAWRARMSGMPYYEYSFDALTFAYFAAIGVIATCGVALAPVLQAARRDLTAAWQQAAIVMRRWTMADFLVATQVAVSLALIAVAAVMLRGHAQLLDSGSVDGDRLIVAAPRLAQPPHTRDSIVDFYRQLGARVSALPGVRTVSFASTVPIVGGENPDQRIGVAAEYFSTMNTPILRGRAIRDEDAAAPVTPVVISESFARAMFADRDPIGSLITLGPGVRGEIVGITRQPDNATESLFVPLARDAVAQTMLVRVDDGTGATAAAIRDIARDLDPNAVVDPQTLASRQRDLAERFLRVIGIATLLGSVAIVLAMIGIYAAAAFAASQRSREMGVRLALGATALQLMRDFTVRGSRPIVIGLAAGLVMAIPAVQALRLALDRVRIDPRNPLAFAVATVLLFVIAMMAMLGPARRAAATDPVVALRQD